jgi:hypothetical protein
LQMGRHLARSPVSSTLAPHTSAASRRIIMHSLPTKGVLPSLPRRRADSCPSPWRRRAGSIPPAQSTRAHSARSSHRSPQLPSPVRRAQLSMTPPPPPPGTERHCRAALRSSADMAQAPFLRTAGPSRVQNCWAEPGRRGRGLSNRPVGPARSRATGAGARRARAGRLKSS